MPPLSFGHRRRQPRSRTASRRSLLSVLPWRKIVAFAIVVGAVTGLVYSNVDVAEVQETAARLPAWIAFAILLVLPLVGFPASLLHVAAGLRFGVWLGLALVALSIFLQLIACHAITQRWRERFEKARWIRKIRERIPEGAHGSVCVFTVLLPGAPFAAINYVLPVLGIPLRTLLLYAWPLHVLRSSITVGLGGQATRLDGTRLLIMGGYAVVIAGASWLIYQRMNGALKAVPSSSKGSK